MLSDERLALIWKSYECSLCDARGCPDHPGYWRSVGELLAEVDRLRAGLEWIFEHGGSGAAGMARGVLLGEWRREKADDE